jgi:hypothetical protein
VVMMMRQRLMLRSLICMPQMAMMLKVRERLQWSRSLLARSVPTRRCRDDASKIDASIANLYAPDGNDAEGEGASSVEPVAPGPIGSNVPM